MKKLFFAICFSLIATSANADTKEFIDAGQAKQYQETNQIKPIAPEERTEYFDTREELIEYIQERFEKAAKSQVDESGELVNMKSMDVQNSQEYIERQNKAGKPTFQKIYENALNKLSQDPTKQKKAAPSSSVEHARAMLKQQQQLNDPNIPTIKIKLPPYGQQVVVPAQEHIPYFFVDLAVLPTGVINVTETITVVNNGQKLKDGLVRAVPKYSTSRTGDRHKIELNLVEVLLDDKPVEYKVEETADVILLSPKNKEALAPGVYTYNINYTVDRRLWFYDDFNELYWDATGSNWNLVITRAGASVALPEGRGFLGNAFFIGYPQSLRNIFAITFKGEDNSLGFVAARPLYIGEGMFIITSFGKEGFVSPDWSRRFVWLVDDYGDGLFALFGFLAIAIAYILSWKDMQKKNTGAATGLKQNAMMLRYLLKNAFDKISFGAFLLEMFKRNIIDIRQNGDDILLVRKSDNIKGLSKANRKALNNLFINKESVLKVDANNALKIKRAYKVLEKEVLGQFKNFTLKISFGYLFFSCAMMLIAFVGIALNQVEFGSSMGVLIGCALVMAIAIYLLRKSLSNKWIRRGVKTLAVIAIVCSFFMLGVFFGGLSALMILLMVVTIFVYTKLFAAKDGLVKNNITKAEEYKVFINNNVEVISLGRDFLAQQPSIFALELSELFTNNDNIKDYYRLDTVKRIVSLL